jgi:hypothetical protein
MKRTAFICLILVSIHAAQSKEMGQMSKEEWMAMGSKARIKTAEDSIRNEGLRLA